MAAAQAPGVSILEFTFTAAADMSSAAVGPGPNTSYQYTAVKPTSGTDLAVSPSSSAGSRVVGVLQTQPASGGAAVVRILGITKLVVDGTTPIANGDMLTTDASGRGVKTTTTGAESFAMALQASTAQNDIISAIVLPAARY